MENRPEMSKGGQCTFLRRALCDNRKSYAESIYCQRFARHPHRRGGAVEQIKSGEVVEVAIPSIDVLRNPVAGEK